MINKPKEFIYSHSEYKLGIWQYLKLNYYLYLLKKGYSAACIVKNKEFYGLNFYVNKDVLIPRPDTEMLVEASANRIRNRNEKISLVDVGTGSGCIPVAIITSINQKIPKGSLWDSKSKKQPTNLIDVIATDISKKALKVARRNAKKHKVDINFLQGSLLGPVFKKYNLQNYSSIIITANLPYLTDEQFKNEPSIQREPKLALIADKSGLALYEKLLEQIKKLTDYNLQITTFFEIDPSQTTQITKLIKKNLPGAKINIIQDLAGKNRVVKIEIRLKS